MYQYHLHQRLNQYLKQHQLDLAGADNAVYTRFLANAEAIHTLYQEAYGSHPKGEQFFEELVHVLIRAHRERRPQLKKRDEGKMQQGHWYASNQICGMSLYVDRFAGKLEAMAGKLPYLEELGVNFLHLMPLFESPAGESDGGYAVSDFRKVDARFGTLDDLQKLQETMHQRGFYLMLDIVLNHTSHRHLWAERAKAGDKRYQDFFYTFPDRTLPDEYDRTMPDIFPESAPGSFTWSPEMKQWVMTVFHNYQWDLNYRNPEVLVAMVDTILFYANLGVDLLRIDAPAFIWKELGTTCQNLPGAHRLLQLIRHCVQVAAPGMALLGEAIVAPNDILKYFGEGREAGQECDVAYNATQMALGWDALATGDTRVMLQAQPVLLRKPKGCTWINYTRCHDDIGLGYDDEMIAAAGFNPYLHRRFLMEYFTGSNGSPARGALFSVNPKTGDARISGSLAALCGLEAAQEQGDAVAIAQSINRILLLQAHAILIGGIPMLYYGDELGYANDFTYLDDAGKSYDNRWMHRPLMNWQRNELRKKEGTVEARVFAGTRRLLQLRKALPAISDEGNLRWLSPHNIHVAGYVRSHATQPVVCLFNFGAADAWLTWYAFREQGIAPGTKLLDRWQQKEYIVGSDDAHLVVPGYGLMVLEVC